MTELSIIIVNYNGGKFILECLDSVYKNVGIHSFEVIVVDNDSTDDSVERIKREFPHVILIKNTNEGFAKANNKGVKVAKGEYLLFLNPDTIVYSKTIPGMLEFITSHKHCGAATCKLEMLNGKEDYAAHRGFPTPWNSFSYFSKLTILFPHSKLFAGYTAGWKDFSKVQEIDALAGAFMLVPRHVGDQVGWWDEDYFFNGEDIDFCYRIKQKGWKIYFVPQYSILHYNGVLGGTKEQSMSTASIETKIRAQHARFDAMKKFYAKHYAEKYPGFLNSLVIWGIEYKRKKVVRKLEKRI